MTSNLVVERTAEALYRARCSKPCWNRAPDHRREGYRETVREVLLAAMNAGLVISEQVGQPFEEPAES